MPELIQCGTPNAPFCRENGMLDISQTSPSGLTVFTQVLIKSDDKMIKAPGAYFIIPVDCYGPRENMPFDFLHEVNWHLDELGMEPDNGTFNYTWEGGARVAHAHFWIMNVQPGDEPAVGLYTTRSQLREARKGLKEALGDASRARSASGSRPRGW